MSLRDADKGELKDGTRLDRSLIGMLEKHEQGDSVFLSDEMRDILNEGLKKAGLKLLKAETSQVDIPPRPIIGPLFSQVKSGIPKIFEKKFMGKMRKYMKGDTHDEQEQAR